jgi:FXSXX-COOH protein
VDDVSEAAGTAVPEWRSVMIDVADLSLAELAATGDDVLAHCLRRLAAGLDAADEPIAGFNSAF